MPRGRYLSMARGALFGLILTLAVAACGQSTPTPTATASPTPSPTATATPSPTDTPTPPPPTTTPTATATATPLRRPSPTPPPFVPEEATPSPTPVASPSPEEPSPTPSPTATPADRTPVPPGPILALRLWPSLSDTSAAVGSSLVLRATVTDQAGQPVPGVIVAFIVHFPGREWADFAPNTDAQGQTEKAFPVTDIGELAPGTVVTVSVWAIYSSDLGAEALTSFTIR